MKPLKLKDIMIVLDVNDEFRSYLKRNREKITLSTEERYCRESEGEVDFSEYPLAEDAINEAIDYSTT
jgi:hypothetical protein